VTGACVVYGATGFTGRQLVEEALGRGLPVIAAGRSAERLRALGYAGTPPGGVEVRVAELDVPRTMDRMLKGTTVLLNAAGPYHRTALPLVEACLRNGVHYLDVTGELPVVEAIAARHDDALAAAVMLMPAVGYAVVPTDCLCLRAARLVPGARRLRIALSAFELFAAGSAKSMLSLVRGRVRIRRDGAMTDVPVGTLERDFDFGAGPRRCTAINWCDAFTAFFSTGVRDVEVYLEADALRRALYGMSSAGAAVVRQPVVQAFLGTAADWWFSAGGHAELLPALANRSRAIVVEATDTDGAGVALRLHSPEPYRVTRESAVTIAEAILGERWQPGFRTPAAVYGDALLGRLSGLRAERRALQQ
jgi:short subunit dehydrogenase-like uncharacterized protein